MMHIKTTFLFICVTFLAINAQADTIRMMQYNLMYYTNTSGVSDCNSTSNNLDNKDNNLKTIIQYAQPDVLCVNEIGSSMEYITRLLNNVLNTDGVDYYANCPLTNYSGGYIANMLYYNTQKLSFHSHFYITTAYRDINAYKMYYNSNQLVNGDTVFITFIIAHLKAGSYETNIEQRYVQAQRLMSRLAQIGVADNYVFSGDFNLYGASELAYQHFIHYSNSLFQFYDPIDQEGDWNNNSAYSSIHTQSTHTDYNSGCFASGGMDDRFDIILVSPYIYYGSNRVQSINSSYHALGQDGHRFNGSIISPANDLIPTTVANALYNQSDHLPVILEFNIDATMDIKTQEDDFYVNIVNPVQQNLQIELHPLNEGIYTIEVFSLEGKKLQTFSQNLSAGYNKIEFPFPFPSSLYIVMIYDNEHHRVIRKVIKNNLQ